MVKNRKTEEKGRQAAESRSKLDVCGQVSSYTALTLRFSRTEHDETSEVKRMFSLQLFTCMSSVTGCSLNMIINQFSEIALKLQKGCF